MMRERRRHNNIGIRSPPQSWPRTRGDVIEDKKCRFSYSYRSQAGPIRSEPDRYGPLGSAARREQSGDVRNLCPSRNREESRGNSRVSGVNRSTDSARPEPDRFIGIGLVQGREYERHKDNGERDGDGYFNELSQFSESLWRKESTFLKFHWDNLLGDNNNDNKPTNTNPNPSKNLGSSRINDSYKISGFSSDFGVVPISTPKDNVGPRTYSAGPTSSRNYGLGYVGGGYVCPLRKKENDTKCTSGLCQQVIGRVNPMVERGVQDIRPVHERTSIMDSIVEKIEKVEGNDSVLREDMMLDDHTSPGDRFNIGQASCDTEDFDCRHVEKVCLDAERLNFEEDCGLVGKFNDVGGDYVGKFGSERRRNMGSMGVVGVRARSIMDSIVDKIEGNETEFRASTAEGQILDNHGSLGASINISRAPPDQEDLDCRTVEKVLDPKNLQLVEDYGLVRNNGAGCGTGFCVDGLARLPVSYEGLYTTESSPQRVFAVEEPGIHDLSEVILKRKHSLEMEMSGYNQESELYCDWYSFDDTDDISCRDGEWANEDVEHVSEQLSFLEDLGLGHIQGEMAKSMIDGMLGHEDSVNPSTYPDLPASKRQHFREAVKPYKRDIKKRLGPACNVKMRLGHAPNARRRLAYARNIKQRLGPAPDAGDSLELAQSVNKKLPWIKIFKERNEEDFYESLNIKEVESLELKKKTYSRTEPPEDSDEFMQLVQTAFLKFVKVLNENLAKQRKYMEQGRTCTLKCCVCGSNSKEFVDTLSLAQHAFMSCKFGCRAEHLGLHKALCVLMGWNSSGVRNSPWVRQILPHAEASLLKEDLIIWPPVVVIHNSSMANDNPDEWMIVSIEELRTILNGMGFGRGMAHVGHGKAANQSTMVASFTGTFSGLQEAERLHGLYAENKRGRAEFQKVGFTSCNSSGGKIQRVTAHKVENVLYGYLGTAGDLDKLDFETKKRCVVKSKKEIEAIANISLAIE